MPQSDHAGEPALDPSILEDLRSVDESLVDDLIRTFIGDVPGRIVRIQHAIANQVAQDVLREAHGLKGSAFAVGAVRLAAVCLALEDAAHHAQLDLMPPLGRSLDTAFADVRTVLEAMASVS